MQSSDAPSWTPLSALAASAPPPFVMFPPEPAPMPVASASASTGAKTGRNAPRKRYPQEAYDLLTSYYDHVNKYPKKPERIELARQVRDIPGCADCTEDKVQQYFAGKRAAQGIRKVKETPEQPWIQAPVQIPHPPVKQGSAHILYPTLLTDPSILRNLDILLEDEPSPARGIAKIWAPRLGKGVSCQDIQTYAKLKRVQPKVSTAPPLRSQLPTPESSISPEPLSTPTSPVVETSWGKVEPEDDDDELESEDEEELDVKPQLEPQLHESMDPRALFIAEELSKAFSAPYPSSGSSRPPKTLKELARWFDEQNSTSALPDALEKPYARPTPAITTDRKPPPSFPGGRMLA